ncbi:SCAN domain-containing protein 3 [Eumeta japonica]|uniref:SCAN domain-containing protein 3 n=1 Tax=Eumeta variegata TaxID=151549 RepID=A0A4C1Y6W1_EUMVA|nr:SCAN domain-containing protein 3 [Eumeta japonica]
MPEWKGRVPLTRSHCERITIKKTDGRKRPTQLQITRARRFVSFGASGGRLIRGRRHPAPAARTGSLVITDGAAAMTGKAKDFITKIAEKNPNIQKQHCFFQREALMTKTLPDELLCVLQETIKVVNYINSRLLNSRLFNAVGQEMGQIISHSCFLQKYDGFLAEKYFHELRVKK